MNLRIKGTTPALSADRPLFSPSAARWLVTIALGCVLVYVNLDVLGAGQSDRIQYPWMSPARTVIQKGVYEFSGSRVQIPAPSLKDTALKEILIFFVLGPTLMLFGWRALARARQDASRQDGKSPPVPLLAFVVGGALTFGFLIPAVPTAFLHERLIKAVHEQQALNSEKDGLLTELNWVAFKAGEYFILPAEKGGGSGSYRGFTYPAGKLSTPEYAIEISFPGEKELSLQINSRKYAGSTISFRVDSTGQAGSPVYTGKFLY